MTIASHYYSICLLNLFDNKPQIQLKIEETVAVVSNTVFKLMTPKKKEYKGKIENKETTEKIEEDKETEEKTEEKK